MCLLAVFFHAVEDAAVVVGANREEFYARGGKPPQMLAGPCRAIAGLDPAAGGTWFGVNEHGVNVAVTNRLKSEWPAQPRSRGLLARDLLACSSASAAGEMAARELGKNSYAGCNILCADRERSLVVHGGDWLRVRPLPPGLHVLTSHDVNDSSDRRIGHALWWLGQRSYANAEQCMAALQELCAQTGDPPMCLRGERSGTVSSSIVALRSPIARSSYLHSQGAPDRTPYTDFSHLFAGLSSLQ